MPPIPVWDRHLWIDGEDSGWTNTAVAGSIVTSNRLKQFIHDTPGAYNVNGMVRKALAARIGFVYQIDFMVPVSGTLATESLWGMNGVNALDFPTSYIYLNQFTGNPLNVQGFPSGTRKTILENTWYTSKLEVTALDAVKTYIDGGIYDNEVIEPSGVQLGIGAGSAYFKLNHKQNVVGQSLFVRNYFVTTSLNFDTGGSMAYATMSDLTADFKEVTFDSTTAITDTDAQGFLDRSSEIIDGYIANKYEVPVVTGTKGMALLKEICLWLAKSKIMEELKIGAGPKGERSESVKTIETRAYKALDELKKGIMTLQGSNKAYSPSASSFGTNTTTEATFKKDEKQW